MIMKIIYMQEIIHFNNPLNKNLNKGGNLVKSIIINIIWKEQKLVNFQVKFYMI
jgi:hypothetical protein